MINPVFGIKDMLMRLAKGEKLFDIKHYIVEETWMMDDNIMLKTSLNMIREEECYKLEMIISEESIKDDTQRLLYFGVDERVLIMVY
jgi:hypothetical protein